VTARLDGRWLSHLGAPSTKASSREALLFYYVQPPNTSRPVRDLHADRPPITPSVARVTTFHTCSSRPSAGAAGSALRAARQPAVLGPPSRPTNSLDHRYSTLRPSAGITIAMPVSTATPISFAAAELLHGLAESIGVLRNHGSHRNIYAVPPLGPRCCEGLAASTSLVQSALLRLLFRFVQAEPVRVVQVPQLESMLRLPILQEGELR